MPLSHHWCFSMETLSAPHHCCLICFLPEFSSFCTARNPTLGLTVKPGGASLPPSPAQIPQLNPHWAESTGSSGAGEGNVRWLLALRFPCHELLHSHARGQSSKGRVGIGVSNTWDPQGRETLPRIILTFNISGSRISVKWFLLFFWVMSPWHKLVQTKKVCVLRESRVCFPY